MLCERVVVPEGQREGTHGCQLRLETAPVDSLLLALSHKKLEETGKEKEEEG